MTIPNSYTTSRVHSSVKGEEELGRYLQSTGYSFSGTVLNSLWNFCVLDLLRDGAGSCKYTNTFCCILLVINTHILWQIYCKPHKFSIINFFMKISILNYFLTRKIHNILIYIYAALKFS